MEPCELQEKVNRLEWMHCIDLGGGVVTPGKWERNPGISAAFEAIDFQGKSVLDVGTCNGLWSFEAEKRGASEVLSVDYLTHVDYWCSPAYRFAHSTLKSKAQYNPDLSAYQIDSLQRTFDIIVFCGLYYHLKHPLLAFAKARKVLKTGGYIVIEGPVYEDDQRNYAKFLYRGTRDRSNWWIPTRRCLREWIECSFFEIVAEYPEAPTFRDSISNRARDALRVFLGRELAWSVRQVCVAKGVTRNDHWYNTVDEDLQDFVAGA